MRILLGHNYYQQRGGEDFSYESNVRNLKSHGHEVRQYTLHSDAVKRMTQIAIGRKMLWNRDAYREVTELITVFKPDVAHFTNLFPLMSPSVLSACKKKQVPIVQDLRNYRHMCPNAFLLRDGRPCEKCIDKKFAWPGIVHKCYRESAVASAVLASTSAAHRVFTSSRDAVDAFVTPTEFAKAKHVQSGFNADRIFVKPNFVDPIPDVGDGSGQYAVFVGRLSKEKGISTLLAAWDQVPSDLELHIVGEGELRDEIARRAQNDNRIKLLGWLPNDQVFDVVGRAMFTVMPSVWYETFGRTIVESFAAGVPVVASDLGCMKELISHDRNGLLYPAGDSTQLAACVNRMEEDSEMRIRMRKAARSEFLTSYTAATNYERIMEVYRHAMQPKSTC